VSDYAVSVHAEPDASKSVDCAVLGWPSGCAVSDIHGTPVPLPMTLTAGTSALLLRSDSRWRQ
jgi:hypothetical protein